MTRHNRFLERLNATMMRHKRTRQLLDAIAFGAALGWLAIAIGAALGWLAGAIYWPWIQSL